MKVLTETEIKMVSGGEMSTKTKVVVATVCVVGGPIVCAGVLVGYYSNTKS